MTRPPTLPVICGWNLSTKLPLPDLSNKYLSIVTEIFLPLVDCPVGGLGKERSAGQVLSLIRVLGTAAVLRERRAFHLLEAERVRARAGLVLWEQALQLDPE